MPNIRLIRPPARPGHRGPSRGMHALATALKAANIPWLKIGGHLQSGEIPWVWLYKDVQTAIQFDKWGWPFICGPNVLFWNSHAPATIEYEQKILDAENCKMLFTESTWYSSLIRAYCNHNEAPIVIWPYPISPTPAGPLTAEYDLLVYLKDYSLGREHLRLIQEWPNSNLVVYGHYDRETMIELARRSRACVYLSTDDRGPLAAAEIAIAGCPLVGIERGCPWVAETPGIGVKINHFGKPDLFDACKEAMRLDHNYVRQTALDRFDANETVNVIRNALKPIAEGE